LILVGWRVLVFINRVADDGILAVNYNGLVGDVYIVVEAVFFIHVVSYFGLYWAQAVILYVREVVVYKQKWGVWEILKDSAVKWDS